MKRDLRHFYRGPVVNLTTYSDITSAYISPKLYQTLLRDNGLVPSLPSLASPEYLGKMVRSAVLKLIMNPAHDMCVLVNRHLAKLRQRHVIGLQIRNGGWKANYRERSIQGRYTIPHFYNEVIRYLKHSNLTPHDVYVVIATDSTSVAQELTTLFQELEPTMVYPIDDFKIGHSAPGKTFHGAGKNWKAFNDRALLDLLILKESDFLVFSQGSSFGQFAHELQQAYNNPISANAFLQEKGMTCSVFNRVKGAGKARMMLKARTRYDVAKEVYSSSP